MYLDGYGVYLTKMQYEVLLLNNSGPQIHSNFVIPFASTNCLLSRFGVSITGVHLLLTIASIPLPWHLRTLFLLPGACIGEWGGIHLSMKQHRTVLFAVSSRLSINSCVIGGQLVALLCFLTCPSDERALAVSLKLVNNVERCHTDGNYE